MPYALPYSIGRIIPTQMANPYATQLFVLPGPLNLFSQTYVPVRRGNQNEQSGGLLLSTPKVPTPVWWHLQVTGRELVTNTETMDQLAASGQLESAIKGGAVDDVFRLNDEDIRAGRASSQVSALKVCIEYVEYPTQRRRRIIQDIGSTFDMPLGPTQQIDVDLLAPDPNGYPGPFFTPEQDPSELQFSSWIIAQCQPCVNGVMSRDHGARYTQSVISGPALAGAAPRVVVPIADGARKLQIFSVNDDPVLPALWVPNQGPFDPALPPAPLFSLGRVGFQPGLGHTQPVDIPQNTKGVVVASPAELNVFTVVQELQL